MRRWCFALLLLSACRGPLLYERPLREVWPQLESSGPARLGERGIELLVDQVAVVMLPFPGATDVRIDVESDAIFTMTFFAEGGRGGPPARYQRIDPGSTTVRTDFLTTEGWSLSGRPVLRLEGTGRLHVRRIATAQPPASLAEAERRLARARALMPEGIGHTTINLLTPPSLGSWFLTDALALVALAVALLFAALARRRARRWRLGAALGGLVAVALFDAHFLLVRYLPLVRRPTLDPEVRIAKNYYFSAELGELAALARRSLPLTARVAVQARPDDWFARQTLCFNLAPRPCVFLAPGAHEHVGIGHHPLLHDDELDAIVVYDPPAPLPEGWAAVAKTSDNAYVARRK